MIQYPTFLNSVFNVLTDLNNSYSPSKGNILRKTPLNKKQRKVRAKNKQQKKSRKNNRRKHG